MKGAIINLTVIAIYPHILAIEEEAKDKFYDNLKTVTHDNVTHHGQVCSESDVCANGHLVVKFASANQIDHVLVRPHWTSSVIDCQVYSGTQTGTEHGSDRLRLHMRAQRYFT